VSISRHLVLITPPFGAIIQWLNDHYNIIFNSASPDLCKTLSVPADKNSPRGEKTISFLDLYREYLLDTLLLFG